PEATGYFQPTVASAVPYEFPSTGSVRLLPSPGRAPGTRAAPAGPPSASGTRPGRAVAGRGAPLPGLTRPPAGPGATAARPATGGGAHAAPDRAAPGPAATGPISARLDVTGPDVTGPDVTDSAARGGTTGRAAPAPVVPRLARGDLFGRHTRSYAAENS